MRTVNLLSAAMNMPQWIFFIILAVGVIFFLLVLSYFIHLMVYKPELRAELANKRKLFKEEKRRIKAENESSIAEIKRSALEIAEKRRKALELESETAKMHDELIEQGFEEERAKKIADMTLTQLQTLKDKELTDVSDAFIINAITRKVLIESEFEKRKDLEDLKVPINKTKPVTVEMVEQYLTSLLEVTHKGGKGKTAAAYSTGGLVIALLYNQGDGKFKMTFKCGSYYGQRLSMLYPDFVDKAKFPDEIIWFEIKNTGDCSMELIKLLIDMSYNIAKAGY